jgi:hypothetical protein
VSRNDNAHTSDEGTSDTTYAYPAHLLGELDAPAAEGVEPRVSAAEGPLSRSALLLVMRGPNAGSQFLLDQPVTSAGRLPDSDIFLDDVTVSRRHVEFGWRTDNSGSSTSTASTTLTSIMNRSTPRCWSTATRSRLASFVWCS